MKTKIEYCTKTYLISLILGILIGLFCVLYCSTESQYTHIESVIKKHNAIKESLEHPYHPTITKPASSQIGVIGQDSVRVIPAKINKQK